MAIVSTTSTHMRIPPPMVSPWCYIATLELRKAIARAYKNQLPLRFQIEYRPLEGKSTIYDSGDCGEIESQGR
jgi:predicted DsbA family dithiol-disulfide isomerase